MAKLRLDGISPVVQPASSSKRLPNILEDTDLANLEEVRFFDGFLDFNDYQMFLAQIQGFCQWWANVGQNPKLIGLEDNNIAIINTRDDGQVPTYVEDGAQLVVQNKDTGKYGIYDLVMPNVTGVGDIFQANNARNTAKAIIDLAIDDIQVGE